MLVQRSKRGGANIMNFTKEEVEKILLGEKTQCRCLVKEGEKFYLEEFTLTASQLTTVINMNGGVKWQVGKDYAVCPGRGKRGLLYCPKCYSISAYSKEVWCAIKKNHKEEIKMKPLRVVIKSIRKEKLLDISESDAKKEGYKNCINFVENFAGLNAKHLPKEIKNLNGMIYPSLKKLELWDPFVWVLEFSIMGGNK